MIGLLKYKHNPFLTIYVLQSDTFDSFYGIYKLPWVLFRKRIFIGSEQLQLQKYIQPFLDNGYIFIKQ